MGSATRTGSCEYNNEHSGSMKNEEFLDEQRDYWVLKKNLEFNETSC